MDYLITSRGYKPKRLQIIGIAAAISSLLLFLTSASPAYAYIGPGAGFAVLGSFLVIIAAVLLAGAILFTWPLRFLLRRRRRGKRISSEINRVVIIGLDGMDPEVAEGMMDVGRLPHLDNLRKSGSFGPLATTCPAMSPVAWSSFMTGTNPGRHGIFDFLHRDPQTYLPVLSSCQISLPRRMVRLGRWQIPLGRPIVRLLRRSRPFWSVLGDYGIFSTIFRVPITFPPERFPGLLLSGMCVPDLRGTQGSFTYFSTRTDGKTQHVGGERILLTRRNSVICDELPGPALPGAQTGAARLPFRLKVEDESTARLTINGQSVQLLVGEYSEWTPLSFHLGPTMRASGICRFYLKQLSPEVELYASPINIDPEHPALPISYPITYSIYLSKCLGRYATLGLAEDTWALNEGVIDDAAFLKQCQLMFAERERMLMNALSNSRHGCVVCVFDTTDRIQHMFWRCREADHPANTDSDASAFKHAVGDAYEQADALVGRVLDRLGPRDALLIISDHGFKSFRRGVNLNAWLRDHGYLTLKADASGETEWLRDVDWNRTRAYAVGLSGLYLNRIGREAEGTVAPEEVQVLKDELIARLTGLQDEKKNAIAIKRVFNTEKTSPGPYTDVGPDLAVGYAQGYRVSWDAARGKVTGPVFEDNVRKWSGDHCLDPDYVPGVLFSNLQLNSEDAAIVDIAPTVLSLFRVHIPNYIEGRSLWPDHKEQSGG